MENNKRDVIILGQDQSNTLGVVRSLGMEGYNVISVLWGEKTNLIKNSVYSKEIISALNVENCIDAILKIKFRLNANTPIIPTCDLAAACLDKNRNRLQNFFVFQGFRFSNITLKYLHNKNVQVEFARRAGFNIPQSVEVHNVDELDKNKLFPSPYMIKPLSSIGGSKDDLTRVKDFDELIQRLPLLLDKTKSCGVLVQQYIVHDCELSVLGCAFKNGDVFIPLVEKKYLQYPKDVGLESIAILEDLKDEEIKYNIKKLISEIGYYGLFSVEMMYNMNDNKIYFTEINLRNDGANFFFVQSGVNLPLLHVKDIMGNKIILNMQFHIIAKTFIWETHLLKVVSNRYISLKQFLKFLKNTSGYLLYYKKDKKPFITYFKNTITNLVIKPTRYKD